MNVVFKPDSDFLFVTKTPSSQTAPRLPPLSLSLQLADLWLITKWGQIPLLSDNEGEKRTSEKTMHAGSQPLLLPGFVLPDCHPPTEQYHETAAV